MRTLGQNLRDTLQKMTTWKTTTQLQPVFLKTHAHTHLMMTLHTHLQTTTLILVKANHYIVLPPSTSLTPSTHTTYSSKGNKQYYIIHCNHILLLAFTATPGLTAQSLQEPIDYFHLLFTEEVKNYVFIETCKYADQKTQQNAEYLQNHKEARGNQWLKKP